MTATQFDIFGMGHSTSPEELLRLRKRELRNLLTSYADEADVIVEILQNAVDAVRSGIARGAYGDGITPTISVVIGRRTTGDPHYIMVSDNAEGMSPDIATRFTTPGYSLGKNLGATVGYKGVGASFFFAAANKIAFRTICREGITTEATVTGAYSWIMSSHEPAPVTTQEMTVPQGIEAYLPTVRGTAVYYEFHPFLKPRTLSHLVLVDDDPQLELRRWAGFLCGKTALGQVTDLAPHGIVVQLILDDGATVTPSTWTLGNFDLDARQLGYPFPWRVFKVHKNIKEIDDTPESSRVWTHKGKHQAVHLRWTRADVLTLSPPIEFSQDEQELVESHLDFVDVFFGHSTDVLNEVNRRLGTRARMVRYGIRLASGGVPQGRMIDFDLTSSQGLSRQAHAVFAFTDLELDTGRKIPANEQVGELIRKISVRAMSLLADYRWAMKKKERAEPAVDLDAWRNHTKERMSNSLVKHLFDKMNILPPIQVDPDTENDVIALFSVLVAQETLRGVQLMALSGFNRYDGLVAIDTTAPVLRDTTDPLSIRTFDGNRDGPFRVLEFKLQFESLLADFESKVKRPQDIDLVICWSLPTLNCQRGSIDYTYGDRNDFRQLYGMTHLWRDENDTSTIPIISLKHLVAEKLKYLEGANPGTGASRFADLLATDQAASI